MGGGAPKSETAAQQQSWTNLNSLFGQASDTSKGFAKSGGEHIDNVAQFFKSLLSGDRTETAAAVAPAANAAREGVDAQRNQAAEMGTSRTGGDVAANQQREDRLRSEIDTLTGGVKPAAAASLGTLGENEITAMMQALGLGTQATGIAGQSIGADINSRREASARMWSSLIGGAVGLATAPLKGTAIGKI